MDKVFYLNSLIEEKAVSKKSRGLRIAGYANTVDKDRVGDIVLPEAWAKGVDNYRINPILLYQHDSTRPIGNVTKITVDPKGIHVEALVSDQEPKIQGLIKEGSLKSFSVGFRVKDQKYNQEDDSSTITEVELLEISIVSIPANQSSLFSVRKSFDTEEEYQIFCKSFAKEKDDDLKLLAGVNSFENGHYHAFEIDEEEGNGKTVWTSHGFNTHTHEIIGREVQEADNHTHQISVLSNVDDKNISNSMVFKFDEESEEDTIMGEEEVVYTDDGTPLTIIKDTSEETVEVAIEAEDKSVLNVEDTTSDVEVSAEETEEEEDEDEIIEENNPYEPIPFLNMLSIETQHLENGTYVIYQDSRYQISKIATTDSPQFQFKEVDINGKEQGDTIYVLASEISVVNEWDLGSEYDIVIVNFETNTVFTTEKRETVAKDLRDLVNMSEKNIYDLKDKLDNKQHQQKLNKLMNLLSTPSREWTDTNFIVAKNICDMIKQIRSTNLDGRDRLDSNFALSLLGHKVETSENKEKSDMATQDVGDPITVTGGDTVADVTASVEESQAPVDTAPVQVREPQVAELVEKAANTIDKASKTEDSRFLSSSEIEEVSEVLAEMKQYRAELSAMRNEKVRYEESQRNKEQFTPGELADAYFLGKAMGLPDDERIFNTKLGTRIKAVTTVDAFLSNFSTKMREELEQELIVVPLFQRINVDARNFRVPVADEDTGDDVAQFASGTFATGIADSVNVPTSNQHTFTAVTFTPHKFMAATHIAKDEEEDTVLPLVPFLRSSSARRMARAIDKSLLRGDGSLSGFTASPTDNAIPGGYDSVITGIADLANAASLTVTTATDSTKATPTDIATARSTMGKYGIRVGTNDLVYLTTVEGYNELVQTADFRTVDTFGAQATYHTGTVGAIWGIPVMITEFLDNVGTTGAQLGLLIYRPGYLIAERRAMLVETEYEPRQQVTAIYMSTRFDMHALTTVASAALSSAYSMAAVIEAG